MESDRSFRFSQDKHGTQDVYGTSGAESDYYQEPVPLDKVPSSAAHDMAPPPAHPMIEPTPSRRSRASENSGGNYYQDGYDENTNELDSQGEYDFPEGGWKAWLVVFGSWCGMTSSFGFINSAGFIQAWLNENQLKDKGESEVSWIFSVYLFLLFFGGVQFGPVFDAYGLKFLIVPGCIGIILSIFFLSLAKEYYQFMLGFGILGGISSSMVFTPSIAVVGHWFYQRRGLATGIAATGGAVGGLVFPLAMNKMSGQLGFAWTIRVVGFIMIGLCAGVVLTLRTRLPPNKAAGGSIDLKQFKDMRFVLVCIGTFMIEWGLFVPLNYIASYAISQGVSKGLAYNIPAFLNVGSIFGRCLPGYMADVFGRFNVMIFTASITGILCLALWLPAGSNIAATIAFAVLFGFWSGTGICLVPVCISQICNTEDYGKRYGTCYFIVSFGVLTGLPIAGELIKTQNGAYTGLIGFSGATYLCGAIFYLVARIVGGGWSVKKIY